LWTDESIPWWYRQNILLFIHSERRSEITPLQHSEDNLPLPLVHPRLLNMWVEMEGARLTMEGVSIKQAILSLKHAVFGNREI
jgi:hypothetical protein